MARLRRFRPRGEKPSEPFEGEQFRRRTAARRLIGEAILQVRWEVMVVMHYL
jgi:hypothetical protein